MNCQELLEQLGDYLDEEARQELCREIEEHLERCNDPAPPPSKKGGGHAWAQGAWPTTHRSPPRVKPMTGVEIGRRVADACRCLTCG